MFRLEDPRLRAVSQAGANFGGGLSDALSQYLENRRLNKAIKGTGEEQPITSETPIQEVISRMAKYNVSPTAQERFLAPSVQQRMQQQEAGRLISEAVRNPQGKTQQEQYRNLLEAVTKAQALSGNFQNLGNILDLYQGAALAGDEGSDESRPSPGGQSMQPKGLPEGKVTPVATNRPEADSTEPESPQPGVRYSGIGGQQTLETVPAGVKTRPYTAQEQEGIRRAQRRQWGLQRGDLEADRIINQRQQQFQNETALLGQEQTAQHERERIQDKISSTVAQGVQRDFSNNPQWRTDFGEMAQLLALQESGDPQQRYNKVKAKYLTPIINKLHTIEKNIPTSEVIGRFNAEGKQNALKRMNVNSQEFINKFPEDYQNIAYDTLRTAYRSNLGIGPVSAEMAIRYPSKEAVAEVNSIGEFTPEHMGIPGLASKKDEKALKAATGKIQKMLERQVSRGESPIVLKELVVNGLGYPDTVFDQAYAMAKENGMKVPAYNITAENEAQKAFSTRNATLSDMFGGSRLLGPMEFSK